MLRRRVWFPFFLLLLVAAIYSAGLAGSGAPAGSAIFADSGQSLDNRNTAAVAAGFLDQDQSLDVFAANSGGNRVWLNNGSGTFSHNGQLLGSAASEGVVLVDADGDEDLDAVVANRDSANQVWLNDGTGQFTAGQTITSTVTRAVAGGDLNGDEIPDLYFANQGGDAIWWGQGDGTFVDSGQSLDANTGYGAALGDLNSDGDLDIFVVNGSGGGAPDTVWINQGGAEGGSEGDFLDSGQALGFIWSSAVALGNLDGAIGLEAFTASWFPQANKVWSNNGAGAFVDSGQALGAEASLGVALGDVDRDLDLDAIVGSNTPDGVALWLNDGSGGFSAGGEAIAAGATVADVLLADLNGDGRDDLFLGVFGPNQVWFNQRLIVETPTEGYFPRIVAARGDIGESSSLVVDANGHPHISYTGYQLHRDGLDYSVWYSRWDGIRWQTERVALVDHIGPIAPDATAIALDSAGSPAIAFVTTSSIHYATRSAGSWSIETLDVGNLLRNRISMDLDASDNPHIVNFSSELNQLVYRVYDGAAWSAEIIDATVTDDLYPGIVLGAGGEPHVSYYSLFDVSVRYAHKTGGGWQSDIVESSPSPQDSPYPAIALDAAGNPAIAYNWNDQRDVKLARWNGAGWDIDVVHTVPASFDLEDKTGLAFDSQDTPHIVYAANNSQYIELTHVWWNGASWQRRIIENSGYAGISASLAVDGQDNPHVSYYDATHQDLRYAAWSTEYITNTVDTSTTIEAVALGVRNDAPAIDFYDVGSGLLGVGAWQAPWDYDPIAFTSVPPGGIASQTWNDRQHISYYDADNSRLLYTLWNGSVIRSVVVDEQGDTGRYNDIVLVGGRDNNVRVAYWDATNSWIKLAELNGTAPPVLHVNNQAPPLSAASGHLAATELPDRRVGISYYDGVNGDLRLATWDQETNSWSDVAVDGAGADVGRLNDVATDAGEGTAVLAYYDETNDAIKVAYETGGSFAIRSVLVSAGGVTDLALALNLNSREEARILYTTAANELRLATLKDGIWRVKQLAAGGSSAITGAALTLDNRLHFVYHDGADGLTYGFRTGNLEFAELPGEPPQVGDGFYNPLDACMAVLGWFLGDENHRGRLTGLSESPSALPRAQLGTLSDTEVFAGMANLFDLYDGGRHYIDLYSTYGAEMGLITLADPMLMWDAYGVLQNFMPGLEALVTGRGAELLVSQEMVDDALDIWKRIAAAGSPGLAAMIDAELAQYDDLQDFVGLTYDEWANALGVQPPSESVYFPFVTNQN